MPLLWSFKALHRKEESNNMRKIGFIGVYDKIDLILCIAEILTRAGQKVIVADATTMQKCKYVVPVINPTKSYITEYEGIDVAVGFASIENIRQYLGLEDRESLEYDIMLLDTDNYDAVVDYNLQDADKLYYLTSFDAYSLKKGIEILTRLQMPLHMTKIFYSKEMLKEEEDYFDFLSLGLKTLWNEEKLYFLLENGDQAATIENQRVSKIKLKNLSNSYRENVVFLVNDIDSKIGERKIRSIIKNL